VAHCVLALGPDNAGGLLRRLIEDARTSLDVAVYELGPAYAALLDHAARRGVAVRVLLDAHAGANSTAAEVLASAAPAVECRVLGGHAGAEAHWKLLLADFATLAAGTGNLLRRDAPEPGQPGTREWWAFVARDSALVTSAAAAFEDAWAAAAPPPLAWRRAVVPAPQVPPVGVPRHPVAPLELSIPRDRVRLVLGGEAIGALLHERLVAARDRVLVTVPYVHTHVTVVRALLDALASRTAAGATVRLLLGVPPEPRDAEALAAIPLSPARVRVMDPARSTTGHAKGVVADGAALVCSANWSGAGLGGNHESALVLDDPRAADWYAAALERDWAVASRLPAARRGPPDG
jgi:phosphatidylserine/phosphatidylglycerophosphate/cardiolipin synthase-like enzyme